MAESGTKYHRARLVDRHGNVLTQGDFTGNIQRKVYDLYASNADATVYADSNTVATWVYNSLQTPWPEGDARGYNFEAALTSNMVTFEGGHTFRTEYYLTRTGASGEGVQALLFENPVETQYGA